MLPIINFFFAEFFSVSRDEAFKAEDVPNNEENDDNSEDDELKNEEDNNVDSDSNRLATRYVLRPMYCQY